MAAILVVMRVIGYNSERGPPKNHSKFGPDWSSSFKGEDFKNISHGSYVKTMSADGGVIEYNSKKGPPKNQSIKIWSQLPKQFQRRRFFKTFSHNVLQMYVKTMWADGGCFWLMGGVMGYNSKRGPPKNLPSKFCPNRPSSV